MSGAGAGGGGIGWVGHGHGAVGAHIARHNAREKTLEGCEAMLKDAGVEVPPRPMSQRAVFLSGFACGLFFGLFIGLIFWELT